MTRIKLCGLSRPEDILAANELLPDYIGFVFAPKSKRFVDRETARSLKALLDSRVKAVGVFVNEAPGTVAGLLESGIIDEAQLHGAETDDYIKTLRGLTSNPIIQAFCVRSLEDCKKAEASPADLILLDSGTGSGASFDWSLAKSVKRPYLLAGGLSPDNAAEAVAKLRPFGVDVSSGIETGGKKDRAKMERFIFEVKRVSKMSSFA